MDKWLVPQMGQGDKVNLEYLVPESKNPKKQKRGFLERTKGQSGGAPLTANGGTI